MKKILESKRIDEIKPYEKNPRHNDAAVGAVIASIQKCGYIAPIVVDEEYVILAGHTRFKALRKLGLPEAQVLKCEGLTEAQKKAYRILDNKTGEIAEWNYELLSQELEGLDLEDIEIGGLSWFPEEETAKKLDEFSEQEEDIIELPEDPITKEGDIWILGDHKLLCGDATKQESMRRLMEEEYADLLLTDPPYNVNYQGGTEEKLKIMNDHMESEAFLRFLKDSFRSASSGMRNGAAFYIWHADTEGENFRRACRESGLSLRQCLIWMKNTIVLGRQDYQWKHEPCLYGFKEDYITAHEPCLYGWKSGASHKWYSDHKQTTVLQFDKPIRNGEHPTMKPVALFEYLICNSTQRGDIVLDQFAGSGTTIIACEKAKRKARCLELDPKYCDVIVSRWEKMTERKAIKG